ncbi:MAG TPA: GNAT family N-acetyltransferase [bacterium]|nr:GNAT family N-acetyltransferase [bacterium]
MSEPIRHPSEDGSDEPRGDTDSACTIRLMRESDVDAVTALDAKETGQSRRPYYAEKMARCVREPRINTSLLAELDGAPVGFLMGRLFFGEFGIPATRAVLDTFGVHPAFRKEGVARALVEQYRKNLEALRVEAIDTLVDWDRTDLLGFFKRMGFRPSRDCDLVWDVARYPFAAREQSEAVDVREAEATDLPAVTAMDQQVLGESRADYFADKWEVVRARPDQNRFLVAELRGEPAGYLISGLYHGEFGIQTTRGVIDSIGVSERFQHRGVASGLLQHLLGWLRERGVTQMETLCRWNDWELLRFFEYAGFRPSARINLEWRFE